MKLDELERLMMENIDTLLDSCKGICRTDIPLYSVKLTFNSTIEGCEFCILRALVDFIGGNSINILLRSGSYLEFFKLDDAIIELGEETALLIPIEEFVDRVNELKDFGLITHDDISVLIEWFNRKQ